MSLTIPQTVANFVTTSQRLLRGAGVAETNGSGGLNYLITPNRARNSVRIELIHGRKQKARVYMGDLYFRRDDMAPIHFDGGKERSRLCVEARGVRLFLMQYDGGLP